MDHSEPPATDQAGTGTSGVLRVGHAEIDLARGELRRGGVAVPMRRKAWQLLVLLSARRGALVGPDEIAATLWPDTRVSPQGLFTLVGEVREALGGGVEARRLVASVRGRGYRMMVETETAEAVERASPVPRLPSPHPCFVGRERELRVIAREWERARAGEPRVVFVAGDPGIGKTTLVNEAIARRGEERFRLARGACFPRRSGGEPYGPMIDAFQSWMAQDDRVRSLAFQQAPQWAERVLATHPTATGPMAVLSSRPDQMLRQAAGLLEAMARDHLHVLVLEDAHWADPYTLDLLSFALRRLSGTRLLVLVTYREREALQSGTPIDRVALELRDQGTQLDLGPLKPPEALRLVRHCTGAEDEQMSLDLFERSGGNPLFLEAFADQARLPAPNSPPGPEAGDTDAGTLPRMFVRIVESQWQALAAESREALELGAIVGTHFDVATVAAALGRPAKELENLLARPAARPPFLSPAGTTILSDGTVCGSYRFRHETFRRVIRDALAPAAAARLHAAVGKAMVSSAARTASSRAAAAAEHLLLGGQHKLAVEQFEKAAAECVSGSAIPEATVALERALECLAHLPASPARDRREGRLLIRYGLACGWLRGPTDPGVTMAYERGLPLLERIEDAEILGPGLRGVWLLRLVRFDYRGMLELAGTMTRLAAASRSPLLLRQAACLRGGTLCFLGRQTEALACLEAARAPRSRLRGTPDVWGVDLDTELACYAAWSATLGGHLDLARERLAEARRYAARADHTGTRLLVLWFESSLAQLTGRRDDLERHVGEFAAIASRENQEAWHAIAGTLHATLELDRGNADSMRLLLETLGGGDGQPTLLIARAYLLGQFAAAMARDGHGAEGLALVDSALATIERNDGRVSESDFWRIKGEIHETMGDLGSAEPALRTALDVARRQGAGLFEHRAGVALGRVLVRTGRREEAEELLPILAPGFAPPVSLQEAAERPPLAALRPPG